jgi:hypothetical protein
MQPKAQRAKFFRRIDVTLGLNHFRVVASYDATFSIGHSDRQGCRAQPRGPSSQDTFQDRRAARW